MYKKQKFENVIGVDGGVQESFFMVFLVQNIFRSWKSVTARSAPDPVNQQVNHVTSQE